MLPSILQAASAGGVSRQSGPPLQAKSPNVSPAVDFRLSQMAVS
jgi:hypothetical protein